MKKAYKPLGCRYSESKFRKKREPVSFVSTGSKIRAGLLKKIDSPLLHQIEKDQDEGKVPNSTGRVFNPFSVSETEESKEKE